MYVHVGTVMAQIDSMLLAMFTLKLCNVHVEIVIAEINQCYVYVEIIRAK